MDLCKTIDATNPDLPVLGLRVLGLYLCVCLTLTYLRRNLPQELLAEVYGVWQATASRVIIAYAPLIVAALQEHVPTVEELDRMAQLIVEATLLECWSWTNHPELYSGKHKTTGVNNQVACILSGRLAWVSDLQGRTRDTEALRRCGLLDLPATDLPPGVNPPSHIGDKGYIRLDMITPKRNPRTCPSTPTTKPTTPPLTGSATRSKESSPTSRHGASYTLATEDH